MNTFEQMMSNLPRLRHLELIAACSNNVIDGERWETITENLFTFEFSFHTLRKIGPRQIDSYRTSLWLQEKRWYIAYSNEYVFSVPYLATTEADDYFLFPLYTTAPERRIRYRHSKQSKLTKTCERRNTSFLNVRTLVSESHPPLPTIIQTADLNQIQNLTLSSLPEQFPIQSPINNIPN